MTNTTIISAKHLGETKSNMSHSNDHNEEENSSAFRKTIILYGQEEELYTGWCMPLSFFQRWAFLDEIRRNTRSDESMRNVVKTHNNPNETLKSRRGLLIFHKVTQTPRVWMGKLWGLWHLSKVHCLPHGLFPHPSVSSTQEGRKRKEAARSQPSG